MNAENSSKHHRYGVETSISFVAEVIEMTTIFILLGIVALAIVAEIWGADSRDGFGERRRQAWFIHDLTGR